jgi:tetratricopeptide (TPR) repeat protein
MLGNIFSEKDLDTVPEQPVSFILAPQKQLRVSAVCDDNLQSWRYYSHHISRFPLDLRAHAQRLFLVLDKDMDTYLAGAMQDLFLALEDKGFAFKDSMLTLSKEKLSDEDIHHFETWLASSVRTEFRLIEGSVLDKGLPGKTEKLVSFKQTQDEQPHYSNIIEEANAYLEYGQVEEAQALLEEELQRNPQDEDIAFELLNIYQYTRDRAAFELTTQQLSHANVALSDTWKEVQSESQDW